MPTTVLNTKIVEIERTIPDVNGLVTTAFNTKIGEVKIPDHAKYITTPEFNKSAGSTFYIKLKHANLATNSDVNAVSQCATKNREKIEKLPRFDLSYFIAKTFLVVVVFKICLFFNQHLVR